MESKPLPSLYLCGDDCEENAFGGIASFNNVDLGVVPDNVTYENLQNHCMLSVNAGSGKSYFHRPPDSEDVSLNSVNVEPDGRPQSITLLSMDDSNVFTPHDGSGCRVENESGSMLNNFAESSVDNSLLPEKISSAELMDTVENTETIRKQIASTDGFVDSKGNCSALASAARSDLNCIDQNFEDDSHRNVSDSSSMDARQSHEERAVSNDGVFFEDEGNEVDAACAHIPSEDQTDNGEKGLNEYGEEIEEDEDEETEEEEDEEEEEEKEEEEDRENVSYEENLSEMLDDGRAAPVKEEKNDLTDNIGCDAGSSISQDFEAPIIKSEPQDLPTDVDVKERPKKPKKKKKRKLESEVEKEGKQRPKKKRRKKNKDRSETSKQKSEFGNARRSTFERKNIRKILDDNLDEETKAAQKEEMERKQRLLEIQEKLRQQALELRAQREKEMLNNSGMERLKNSALKSLLEEKADSPSSVIGDLMKSHGTVVPRPQKAPDVVEISSSDEEEDNDIIMMSEEEDDKDEEEDMENSGSHVNDALNRPDAQGCVLVNVGHPSEELDIFLAPQLASIVKPHQIGGIRFLYDNVVESLERYKTSNGFGCILAHSMGLGKTIQVIAFIDIYLRHTGARSVLIIVPVNTLQNWINEFNMWLPTVEEENRASIDPEILWPRDFKLHVINDNMKMTAARAKVVADWHETGGVLLLGYEMYRLLIKTKGIAAKPKRSAKRASAEPLVIDIEEEEGNKELVKALHEALMRPGPDLVICDEGHRIKNSHASISQVLKNIRTKRRVVLTGYPLQNNLLEYWCMVDFVRPNYLGTKTEFCNMFERPIMNGQCVDSTPSDVKLMRFRAHVLHSLLEGFVQRRGHTVLQTALPAKEEYVIFIRMSPIQRKLYNEFMSSIKDSGLTSWSNSNNPIKAFSVCCKIWNHPDILYQIVEQRKDDNDLDIEDTKTATDVPSTTPAPGKAKGKGKQRQNNSAPTSAPPPGQTQTPGVTPMSSQAPGQTQVPGQAGLTQMPVQNQIPGPDQAPGMMQMPDSSLLPGLIQSSGQAQVPCLVQDPGQPMNGAFGMSEEMAAAVLPGVPSSLASAAASAATTPGPSDATTAAGVAGPATPDDESIAAAAAAAAAAVIPAVFDKKESQVISYDWATNLMKDYLAGVIEHSGKMLILLDIIEESVAIGDKILVFSQSLFTLSLIEDYLAKRIVAGTEETWVRNRNYFRLDGSTSGIDREKLINQFNDDNNDKIHLFLLSTRAGCLGINLVGASRVVIFDASWNPCHDCQAVCRVYRYGQTKCCYVYRLVTDNTMEKNIYDRQINKQGISDRVVDELNPQNLLSRKQVDILMRYEDADLPTIEAKDYESASSDPLLGKIVTRHYNWITKEPFTHESLLLDRKDQKLTKHEKRLAKQGYEMEKKMSSFGLGRPGSYSAFYQKNADGMPIIRYGASGGRPVASVRPMMSTPVPMNRSSGAFQTRILGQNFGNAGMKPGVSVQQVQTTTDIIIPPTNTTSDSAPSKIPAGEKVLIIKTPKGVYIRTSHGKIFAVRTASKTTTTSVPSSTTVTSTTSQAMRKTAPSTTTRATATTVSFVSTVTGSTATNTQSTVKSMTSSTGAPTASTTNSEAVTSLVASTSASAAMATPVPSAALQKSALEVKPPAGQQAADGPVKPTPQLNQLFGTTAQPPRVPVLPAVVATAAANTKAATASISTSKSVSSVGNSSCRATGGSVVGGAHVQHANNSITGVTPSTGSYGVPPAHTLAAKNSGHGMMGVPAPAEDRSDHEPMWDRAPGFDDLLSDSDDPNTANVVHPGLDQPRQQSTQQPGAADSFYHGFLGGSRSSPSAIVPNSNETQPSGFRQSSSKAFVPVDHRTPQSVPPRHPMPMAPPYLPPAMGPYGMPSPYPWMPSMPHMWMQPMGPMGRMGMDGFQDTFNSSDGADFSNEMNFDDLGSDDRSFSSLLLGSESDDILGRRSTKGLDGSRTSSSAYRHGTSMPYSSGMGGYPYHPYPYNMPQGGYYPPPHPSPNPSSQGPSTSMNRSYIPMHYPTPMPASHMGMHPGYMPPPGMMPAYDMSAASTSGRNLSGKKHEFDLKDN